MNYPNMVKAFTIWKQLFDDGIMQPGAIGYQQYPDANNDFLTGKYAMVMMGTWYMQYATKAGVNSALSAAGVSNPTPFPVVPIPFPKVGDHQSPMFGDADYGLAIAKKSKNIKAAETFVKWLTLSQDGQQLVANTLNDIPALKSATPNWDGIELVDKAQQEQPLKDLIQRSTESSETRFLYVVQDVSDGILKAATGVADGSVTPKAALDQLQQTAESAAK
jgi:ABC-type glycerol-3-phosphate transport system substrate-binding protein